MKRQVTASLLALGLGLSATEADAKTFVIVDSTPTGWTIIDPMGMETTGGGVVQRTWTVQILRNILNSSPGQPGYVRTQTDYDCGRREFRWREFTAFSRSGDALVNKQNPAYHWESVDKAPDTLAAFQVACGMSIGRGVVTADSIGKLVISIMAGWDKAATAPPPKPKPVPPKAKPKPAKPAAKTPLKVSDLWP
jgi:hypothetical protein